MVLSQEMLHSAIPLEKRAGEGSTASSVGELMLSGATDKGWFSPNLDMVFVWLAALGHAHAFLDTLRFLARRAEWVSC